MDLLEQIVLVIALVMGWIAVFGIYYAKAKHRPSLNRPFVLLGGVGLLLSGIAIYSAEDGREGIWLIIAGITVLGGNIFYYLADRKKNSS